MVLIFKCKVDLGKLVESGLYIIGVIVVLNIGSFCVFVREVFFYMKSNSLVMVFLFLEI